MKHSHKYFYKFAGTIALLFCVPNLQAQSYSLPTHQSDHGVGCSMQAAGHIINSAVISYAPNCGGSPCNSTNKQLEALVTDDMEIYVKDGTNSQCLTYTGRSADVVLANNTSNNSHYIMAVVYAVTSPVTCFAGDDIVMNIYDISGVGTGSLVISAPTTYNITPANGTSNRFPHIDIIAEWTTLTAPGSMPRCTYAAISWVDPHSLDCNNNSNNYYGLNICLENLNSPSSYPTVVARETSHVYTHSDVAAVEAYSSGYYVAYLTVADVNGNMYQWEVDDLNGTPSPVLINLLATSTDDFPRIDAIDNYVYNDYSGTGTNDAFLIVDADASGVVQGYYGVAGTITNFSMGGWVSVTDYYPQVTAGPGQNYTVAYYHADGTDEYISTSFSWASAMSTPSTYYGINTSGIPNSFGVQHSLSSTCNDDGTFTTPYLFAAWENMSNYPTSPYIYWKDAANTGLWRQSLHQQTLTGSVKVSITPNPAKDEFSISLPQSITTATYALCDISGRELLNGAINNSAEINISTLDAGLYVVHIRQNNQDIATLKLIKQ